MTPEGRQDLTEDFNKSAKQYLADDIGSDLLLAKFKLLTRFEAQAVEEKQKLAHALFDAGAEFLERRAAPTYSAYIGKSDMESITSVLQTCAAAEYANFLPGKAPSVMASVGMKFVRRAEKAKGNDRERYTQMAQLCLKHAEHFKSVIDKRTEDVSTSKPITAKRLVLKKDGGLPDL